MIVFGWGDGAKALGEGFLICCPNCGNTRQWIVAETSKRFSLYFVPVAKWRRQYWLICPVCSHGVELVSRELAQDVLAAAFRDPTEVPAHILRSIPMGQD